MAILLSCRNLSKSFGSQTLFESLSFGISDGDRIGMIGPNGTGKSTLMKVLAGLEYPDSGEISLSRGTRVCYLPQEESFAATDTVHSVLLEALADADGDAYEKEIDVAMMIGRVGFDGGEILANQLSGGWRKRLAIARQLILKPNLLLMDEPTNHLDVEGILWLERLLIDADFACLAVSHDRYFLEAISNRVIEINRRYPEGHFSGNGSYSDFLVQREAFFERQLKNEEVLANKVRREVDWLRRGPKARTTKANARITEANRLIDDLGELKSRNSLTKSVRIDFTASERQTKKLLSAKEISKSLGGKQLFTDLELIVSPGMRIGLLGLNGSGKTTLLKTLSGELSPDAGTIERADRLRVVFFNQNRDQLDTSQTLRRALTPYGDQVVYRDSAMHIATWAKRFLFQPEQLEMRVSELSGGERARILIARLMQEPADLLILDEPTNDLDIPTLEVLEESLSDFPGALLLVTHDRYMLDRISNVLLALDGKGGVIPYADYAQWESDQKSSPASKSEKSSVAIKSAATFKPAKLSYKEQFELDKMEATILLAEESLAACQKEMADSEVLSDAARLAAVCARLKECQDAVDSLYQRWAILEAKTKK